MSPQSRTAVLAGSAVALTIPYLAFAVYFSLKFPPKHWPVWFTNVLLFWFLTNFAVVYLIGKKMAKKAITGDGSRPIHQKASARVWILRIVGSYLVLVWSILFLYGVKGTVRGEYPLVRAIPAGAFLLFFILLFGWGVYRSFRPKAQAVGCQKSV